MITPLTTTAQTLVLDDGTVYLHTSVMEDGEEVDSSDRELGLIGDDRTADRVPDDLVADYETMLADEPTEGRHDDARDAYERAIGGGR